MQMIRIFSMAKNTQKLRKTLSFEMTGFWSGKHKSISIWKHESQFNRLYNNSTFWPCLRCSSLLSLRFSFVKSDFPIQMDLLRCALSPLFLWIMYLRYTPTLDGEHRVHHTNHHLVVLAAITKLIDNIFHSICCLLKACALCHSKLCADEHVPLLLAHENRAGWGVREGWRTHLCHWQNLWGSKSALTSQFDRPVQSTVSKCKRNSNTSIFLLFILFSWIYLLFWRFHFVYFCAYHFHLSIFGANERSPR